MRSHLDSLKHVSIEQVLRDHGHITLGPIRIHHPSQNCAELGVRRAATRSRSAPLAPPHWSVAVAVVSTSRVNGHRKEMLRPRTPRSAGRDER